MSLLAQKAASHSEAPCPGQKAACYVFGGETTVGSSLFGASVVFLDQICAFEGVEEF